LAACSRPAYGRGDGPSLRKGEGERLKERPLSPNGERKKEGICAGDAETIDPEKGEEFPILPKKWKEAGKEIAP